MEFIENNYVLIIVIGVIVLMTIIGYFADKMETKEPKQKKKKKEKKNQIMEQVPDLEMEVKTEESELPPEWDENHKPVAEEQEIINIEGTADTEDWNVLPTDSVEVNSEESTEIDNDVQEDSILEDSMFDFNADNVLAQDSEINSLEIPEVEYVPSTNDNMDEAMNFGETVNTNDSLEQAEENQEIIEEVMPEQIDELNDLEITLPDIQSLTEEENKTDDDEDVWKF